MRTARKVFAVALLLLLIGDLAAARSQLTPLSPAAPVSGTISGIVVDGSTGAPVAGALVFIAASPARPIGPQTRQVTDERGRFVFVNLPANTDYTIASSKFGYLDGGYGRETLTTDTLRIISLAPTAWVQNIRATLWKPGVIAGTVRDETGEPVVGVYVRVLAKFNIYGRADLVSGPVVATDDRGEYRFAGLSPGKYLMQVPSVQATVPTNTPLPVNRWNELSGAVDIEGMNRLVIGRYPMPPPPVSGRPLAYGVAFHPSASGVEQATTIELGYGEERLNADIALAPVQTARVSGVVLGPANALVSLTLRLLPVGLENLGIGSEVATALVRPDGSFLFLNVPAGRYVIDAPNSVSELALSSGRQFGSQGLPPPAGSSGYGSSSDSVPGLPGVNYVRMTFRGTSAPYSGRLPVTVSGSDVTGLSLRLRPHVSMQGRIVVEADPNRPQMKPPERFPVRLDSATGEAHLGWPSSNSQEAQPPAFAVPDIPPGLFFLRVYGYPGWLVKTISWKGRDVTDTPFDTSGADNLSDVVVTVTNAVPELAGAVRDGGNLKADASIVVLFPVDRARWRNAGLFPTRFKLAAPSNAGTFLINSAPAGDYFVAAIDRAHVSSWTDAAFLTRLERTATRVTLGWGAKTSQDLTMVEVR